jgi:hypothetical protein
MEHALTESDSIRVIQRRAVEPLATGKKSWKYLQTRAFSTRYVLASHFLGACRSVIEIGGSVVSIDQFLTGDHESVTVLDPLIRDDCKDSMRGRPCRVTHVGARFQDVDWVIPHGADYGLVMLGLELVGLGPRDFSALYELVNRAKRTVIEFASSWSFSREQFEMIRANTRTRVTLKVKLDLGGNDFGDLEDSWAPRCERELDILEPDDGREDQTG